MPAAEVKRLPTGPQPPENSTLARQKVAADLVGWLDAERPKKRAVIAAMFASYPSAKVADPGATIEAYVEALEHLDLAELRRAINRARLDAGAAAWVPSAGQILLAAARVEPHEVAYHPLVEPEVRARDLTIRRQTALTRRRFDIAEARAISAGELAPGDSGASWALLERVTGRLSAGGGRSR